jgi:hypothetical protein
VGDTGNYTITDTYLKDFAQHQIQSFLDDVITNPALLALFGFANGTAGGAGTYGSILPGNVKVTNVSPSAQSLQENFKNFAGGLHSQITNLQDIMKKFQGDLVQVDSVLNNGEDSANITAAEMMQDLNDILAGGGPSTSLPGGGASGSTPPSTQGH